MAVNITYLSLSLFDFAYMPPVEIVMLVSYVVYTLLFRNGRIWKKVFWSVLAYALLLGIALFVPTMLSLITGIPTIDVMIQLSSIRVLVMIIARIINIIIFYILSLNKKPDELTSSPSLIICFIVPVLSSLSIVIIYYILLKNSDYNVPDSILYIMAIGYLVINIIIFILYEMINKEAEKNYILTIKHKQYEITEQHNAEIKKIYSDMMEWRHDYVNHMQVVVTLIEKLETDEAVNYIKNIDEKITAVSSMISTGNYIVDAIVSAKMTLASSFNIKFEYTISLPERLMINDEDLCAVLSNLLDNAIEACCKLANERYINLEIVIIKNQLHIKLLNSTNGEYKKENGKFQTTKQGKWHGIGLKHIESIVLEYSGIYKIEAGINSFTTQISIPLTSKK